ncbi:MAG: hypothetical protein ACYC1C_15830 [Chloroflexota bacterium]
MKRVFLILVLIITLITVLVLPAAAAETVPARVSVNEYINLTVTDAGSDGVNFGSVNPNTTSGDVLQTPDVGAVTLTVAAETNVNCSLQMKGTTFQSGTGDTISIMSAKWAALYSATPSTQQVSLDYQEIGTSNSSETSVLKVWHWLNVPAGSKAGAYTSAFSYQAVRR